MLICMHKCDYSYSKYDLTKEPSTSVFVVVEIQSCIHISMATVVFRHGQ